MQVKLAEILHRFDHFSITHWLELKTWCLGRNNNNMYIKVSSFSLFHLMNTIGMESNKAKTNTVLPLYN